MRTIASLFDDTRDLPCAVRIHDAGESTSIGGGDPAFEVFVRNERGRRAVLSLDELPVIEAYMRGDIDIEGDFVRAMEFQDVLRDRSFWIRTWRWVRPLLVGRERCNPDWIAKHYDAGNVQLLAIDREYDTYTPGLYDGDGDTLEAGAKRKLEFAHRSLRLRPGASLLDVGCGWGGFLRYCAEQGVHGTGISLSRHQIEHARERCRDEGLDCRILYRDFFTHEPEGPVDAVSMMGVMEDLSDYDRVLERISGWLEPGGRVYMDFATDRLRFSTSSFITKYVWPGTFRKVYLPELVESIWRSPFEIVGLYDDRRNYHLWSRKVHERWVERKAEVRERVDEETWRMFRVLFAAAESIMARPGGSSSAARLVLERTALGTAG